MEDYMSNILRIANNNNNNNNSKQCYAHLYELLDRFSKEYIENNESMQDNFSNLFGRLQSICDINAISSFEIQTLRLNALKISRNEIVVSNKCRVRDISALTQFIHTTTSENIPNELKALINHTEEESHSCQIPDKRKIRRIRFHLTNWDNRYLMGYSEGCPTKEEIRATYPSSACYNNLTRILAPHSQLNLLNVTIDTNGDYLPEDIIYEPDYLIDISALCRCVQPYGTPPILYILQMFEQIKESPSRLLGEASNLFLDDCVNDNLNNKATYDNSIKKFFSQYSLQLSICKDIDTSFFKQAKEQFSSIHSIVNNVLLSPQRDENIDNILLEPSFLCEALGLQGRMDYLSGDFSTLIELKSGKENEYYNRSKDEHKLQVALYKEIIHYNLDIQSKKTNAFILYSRYPKFRREDSDSTSIQHAMMLHNEIVAYLFNYGNKKLRDTIENLTPETINQKGIENKLWTNFQRPQIAETLACIQCAKEIVKDYFFGFSAFTIREMQLSKIGDNRCDTSRGFADTWNAPLEVKQSNGNILINLKIKSIDKKEGISSITLTLPASYELFLPNFRKGDTAILYIRNSNKEIATNSIITRGSISEINSKDITFRLRHTQRNNNAFPTDSLYAVEHDYMDGTYRTIIRDLFSLLKTPTHRMELLLGTRIPESDFEQQLKGNYINDDINRIVLSAKQASELYLLVGPPGTGKTSQALSSIVKELHIEEKRTLLLLSYTNRAVDEICEVLEKLPHGVDYIRIGNEQSCEIKYTHRLLANVISNCRNRQEIVKQIESTTIFVGTISSLSGKKELFQIKKFHAAIIDEASQILESQMAGLFSITTTDGEPAIEKFILIGDPKQLPAVVQQNSKSSETEYESLKKIGIKNYTQSLFERLHNRYQQSNNANLIGTLNKQGRMHPDVCAFANSHFYNNCLEPVPLKHQCCKLPFTVYDTADNLQTMLATKRTIFIPTSNHKENGSVKSNRDEAKLIALTVYSYYRLCMANGRNFNPESQIGIIVPFRSQIALVTKELGEFTIPECEKITIDTVERFQGSQREIILFGTTIGEEHQIQWLSNTIEDENGKMIDRKLNVAITRAKEQIVLFGIKDILIINPLYRQLIEHYCK